jgi:hypothetical protein
MSGRVRHFPSPSRHKAGAFTLVELVVVIGIIAVLIAILMPVLNKARAAANRTVCLSNVRQLGLGISMYCDNNFGYFPTCAVWADGVAYVQYPDDWIWWQANRNLDDSPIATYLNIRAERLKAVLRRPADSFEGRKPHPGITSGQGPYLYSYGMNANLGLNVKNSSARSRITQWKAPSRKIMFTEMTERYVDAGWWSPGAYLAWRHGTGTSRGTPNGLLAPGTRMGTNVSAVFLDGHAEGISDDVACDTFQDRREAQ